MREGMRLVRYAHPGTSSGGNTPQPTPQRGKNQENQKKVLCGSDAMEQWNWFRRKQ